MEQITFVLMVLHSLSTGKQRLQLLYSALSVDLSCLSIVENATYPRGYFLLISSPFNKRDTCAALLHHSSISHYPVPLFHTGSSSTYSLYWDGLLPAPIHVAEAATTAATVTTGFAHDCFVFGSGCINADSFPDFGDC